MDTDLTALFAEVEPFLVGVWKFKGRGQEARWRATVLVNGDYFDIRPEDTIGGALQSALNAVTEATLPTDVDTVVEPDGRTVRGAPLPKLEKVRPGMRGTRNVDTVVQPNRNRARSPGAAPGDRPQVWDSWVAFCRVW